MIKSPFSAVVILLLLTGAWARCAAQSGTPQDPKSLMEQAHAKNGLLAPGATPWHIRARYSAFELNGQFAYEGTYEEWWLDATHYKVRFTTGQFTQTDYATGDGLFRQGKREWLGGRELRLRTSLLDPLPEAGELSEFEVSKWSPPGARGSVSCVLMRYPLRGKGKLPDGYYPTACFEPGEPVLRFYRNQSSEQINYDQIVLFQGHYVAQQIQYIVGGQLVGALQVDVLEPLKEPAAAVLAVPPEAARVDLGHIAFSALDGTGAGGGLTLLKKEPPRFPLAGLGAQYGGMVDLEASVAPDGHVADLKLLSEKNMMSVAAMDAVREWSFMPFDVMGQPRQIEAEIKLLFATR